MTFFFLFFFLILLRPPTSTLFPYTTLFRSDGDHGVAQARSEKRRERNGEDQERAGQHGVGDPARSEEHTSELQSRPHLVCRLLLEKKKKKRLSYEQIAEGHES